MVAVLGTIYLDHHATTPVDSLVVEAMLPYFTTHFGNPSGTETPSGRRAAEAVTRARGQVAALLHAEPNEIVFTGGATEANNIAILGTVKALKDRTKRRTILTTPIEHKAVTEVCRSLEPQGFTVRYLPILPTGRVDLEAARGMINDDTLLVSVQTANNEIGTIQPIQSLAEITHQVGGLFHSDAAQAIGKIEMDVYRLGVDMLSLSGHKFHAPKGTGALFVRNGPRSFPIHSVMFGGGQEQSLRPGTINVPGVVGLGRASELAIERLDHDSVRIRTIRDAFERAFLSRWDSAWRNGDLANRLPNNSSVTFPGFDAQAIIAHTPELEFSTGSACTAGAIEPSHVLQAIGLDREHGYSTLRFGFGRLNTLEEAQISADRIVQALEELLAFQAKPADSV